MKFFQSLKKSALFLSALAVCSFLAAAAPSQVLASELPVDYPVSEPLCVWGTVSRFGDRLSLKNVQGDAAQEELILNISGETRILDAVNGYPAAADSLQDGTVVYAYISQAMALSLPPQSHAELILCEIPADFAVPSYEAVKSLTPADTQNTAWQVTTLRGSVYKIDASTILLPYLTRNIVTAQDLIEGRNFLVWSSADGTASKIVMFPPKREDIQPAGPASDPQLTGKIVLD